MTLRISPTAVIVSVLSLILLFTIAVIGAYALGKHLNYVDVVSPEAAERGALWAEYEAKYASSLDALTKERNKASNDFDAACYQYRHLYDVYETLYAETGAASGQQKLGRPGAARGAQDPCYYE